MDHAGQTLSSHMCGGRGVRLGSGAAVAACRRLGKGSVRFFVRLAGRRSDVVRAGVAARFCPAVQLEMAAGAFC